MKEAAFLAAWLALLLACPPENGIISAALAQQHPDIVILRDGTNRLGNLESCDGEVCVLSGSRLGQASIEWIGLRRAPPPPAARDKTRTEVHRIDKTVVTAMRVTMDRKQVVADGKTHPRGTVAWVHLARVAAGATWNGRMEYTFTSPRSVHTGRFDIAVQSDARGVLRGQLIGEETYKTNVKMCNAVIDRKLAYEAVLAGQVNRANGGLAIDIESETSVPGMYHLQPPCPHQPMQWGGPNPYILYDETVRRMLKSLTPSKDGTFQASETWPIPGEAVAKATLTVRPADK